MNSIMHFHSFSIIKNTIEYFNKKNKLLEFINNYKLI